MSYFTIGNYKVFMSLEREKFIRNILSEKYSFVNSIASRIAGSNDQKKSEELIYNFLLKSLRSFCSIHNRIFVLSPTKIRYLNDNLFICSLCF